MKTKNLGKALLKSITKKGIKKFYVAKLLGITRPTLNARLIDGEFNEAQIDKLYKDGLLLKKVEK